jgi:hypothetical protein
LGVSPIVMERTVKTKKIGKAVTFEVSAWWNSKDQKIRLTSKGPEAFILTVRDDPHSKRGHPKLFRELTKILRKAGAPAPE